MRIVNNDNVLGRPVRVLQVLGGLERGGAETWMMQLLESMDKKRVVVDILVNRLGGAFEGKARSLGAGVFPCGNPHRPLGYMANFRHIINQQGPYDVVHSHIQLYSGWIMRLAYDLNIPGRVVHARNSKDDYDNTPFRLAYRSLMRYWIGRYATHLFAVSQTAGAGMFGKSVAKDDRYRIMTGFDFSPFNTPFNRGQIRAELGIDNGTLVIGHVGNFRPQKNHRFIIDLARELIPKFPDVIFLFIGDGVLRGAIEDEIRACGMGRNFLILGERADVPRLLHAMDIFVFPSLFEGLPRALVEAQSAGLPCVASQNIDLNSSAWLGNVPFLPLDDIQIWVKTICKLTQEAPTPERGLKSIQRFEERGMSISANANELTILYEKIANKHHERNN